MEVRRAYCSAVDRNVPVVLRAGVTPTGRHGSVDPADLTCLDYKVRCNGWCCPLYSVSDDAARDAIAVTSHAADAVSRSAAPTLRKQQKRWGRPT